MCYNKLDTVCARRIYWAWLFLVFYFVLSSFIEAEGAGGKLALTVQDAKGFLWRQKEIYVYKQGIDPADGKKKLIDNKGHYIEVGNILESYYDKALGSWQWFKYPIAKAKTDDKGKVSIDLGTSTYVVYVPLGEDGRFGFAIWDLTVKEDQTTPPPPPVLPSTLVKIEPGSQEVNKGRQFTVSIAVEGAKGLAGFQMGIKYNPAVLEVVEVKEGDFLKGGGGGTNWLPPTIDKKAGVVNGITGVRTSPGGVDGIGIIATLTFKAIAEGESPLTLQNVLLSDSTAKKMPTVTQDARVKVTPGFPPWDVNQDGVVNIFDFVLIGQHFGESPPTDPRADVNNDGVVNIFDFVLVGQHFGETSIPAAASVLAMDYAQHLSALKEIDALIATQPNSSEVLELKRLLNRLIALAESQIIPSASALGQNYPNPFNPETWLPYQLSEASEVTMTIYDTQGRVVKRMDLGYQPAGTYRTKTRAAYWDGRNELGERVASGVYVYQLVTSTFKQMKRMVSLK